MSELFQSLLTSVQILFVFPFSIFCSKTAFPSVLFQVFPAARKRKPLMFHSRAANAFRSTAFTSETAQNSNPPRSQFKTL